MSVKEACMRLTWFPFGSDRQPALAGLVLAVAFVLGAVSLSFAQAAAPPQQPAAAQEAAPAKPALAFQNDAGLIIVYIKADKTAEFEGLMTKLKEGLAKMDTPEAKQQAASLQLFKNPNVQGGIAVYVLFADPVVKNVEYWFLPILYKAYPADGQALLQQWTDAKAATPPPTIFDLSLVMKMQ
jgi:hypothetical protein